MLPIRRIDAVSANVRALIEASRHTIPVPPVETKPEHGLPLKEAVLSNLFTYHGMGVYKEASADDLGKIWVKKTYTGANGQPEDWLVVYTNDDNDIIRQAVSHEMGMQKAASASNVSEVLRLLKDEGVDPTILSPNYIADFAYARGLTLTSDEVVYVSDNYGEGVLASKTAAGPFEEPDIIDVGKIIEFCNPEDDPKKPLASFYGELLRTRGDALLVRVTKVESYMPGVEPYHKGQEVWINPAQIVRRSSKTAGTVTCPKCNYSAYDPSTPFGSQASYDCPECGHHFDWLHTEDGPATFNGMGAPGEENKTGEIGLHGSKTAKIDWDDVPAAAQRKIKAMEEDLDAARERKDQEQVKKIKEKLDALKKKYTTAAIPGAHFNENVEPGSMSQGQFGVTDEADAARNRGEVSIEDMRQAVEQSYADAYSEEVMDRDNAEDYAHSMVRDMPDKAVERAYAALPWVEMSRTSKLSFLPSPHSCAACDHFNNGACQIKEQVISDHGVDKLKQWTEKDMSSNGCSHFDALKKTSSGTWLDSFASDLEPGSMRRGQFGVTDEQDAARNRGDDADDDTTIGSPEWVKQVMFDADLYYQRASVVPDSDDLIGYLADVLADEAGTSVTEDIMSYATKLYNKYVGGGSTFGSGHWMEELNRLWATGEKVNPKDVPIAPGIKGKDLTMKQDGATQNADVTVHFTDTSQALKFYNDTAPDAPATPAPAPDTSKPAPGDQSGAPDKASVKPGQAPPTGGQQPAQQNQGQPQPPIQGL